MKRRWTLTALPLLALSVLMGMAMGCGSQAEPKEAGYYEGPRRSKNDPNVWVDSNGKVVPAPKDAAPDAPTGKQLKKGD